MMQDQPAAAITEVRVTPVAFADPPLLNAVGVHEPWALRSIVELVTDSGEYGLGESYGDAVHVQRLRKVGAELVGLDAFDIARLRIAATETLAHDTLTGGHGTSGMVTGTTDLDRVFAPLEVAALDVQGKLLNVPVTTLLGGRHRESIPFSGYLFYKWAGHPGDGRTPDTAEADGFGTALDPEGIVAQAEWMVERYGFTALKLKGGVFDPHQEASAIEALAARFPGIPLRLDPNAAWTVETSIEIGRRLGGTLEYLEDPTAGFAGMAEVRGQVPMPLATNMCVVAFDHLPPAVAAGSIDIVLSDHHFWGGLRRSQELAGIADTFGLGLSMHSNSHLGVSLAAMLHFAAAARNIDYACDTHWPWKQSDDDVVEGSPFTFAGGSIAVPSAPGLGVTLDRDRLARLNRAYEDCGLTARDDTTYMRRFQPAFSPSIPRF
ncbi:enolase C-terminal domain-like protein [Brevibacterium album]|uniref:enolase C-terminal domain-like protein n=1 Tax=Brevibacterium album TaxID=417948 RepID=UPI00041D4831|nr:enolase C-terminal domain-like protein [Brevibacterium album]